MRKFVLKSSVLTGILSLFFALAPLRTGSLNDITQPYLGEYECKSATYGKKDILGDFSYVMLELKADETFVLRYADKKGERKGEERGTYVYDKERERITFQLNKKGDWKREFSLKDGGIFIALKMGNKTLSITFEQK